VIRRRDFVIGGACLAAAASAEAIRPRTRMSLLGNRKLDSIVPSQFGPWRERPAQGLVTPQSENSLAARLYTESLGRFYERGDGAIVMMLIAYGDTQSDSLQLHRPEVCYPAFGFSLSENRVAQYAIAPGVALPGRNLTATSPNRDEHISYWTRIGEFLPTSNGEQRAAKLRQAIAGLIPDGVLVRLSSVETDPALSFALNASFAADLINAMRPDARPALITTAKAQALLRADGRAT
jgi:EpsI family protein